MKEKLSIRDVNLKRMRVFIRVDFNIQVLVRHGFRPKKGIAMAVERVKQATVIAVSNGVRHIKSLLSNFRCKLSTDFGFNRQTDMSLPNIL